MEVHLIIVLLTLIQNALCLPVETMSIPLTHLKQKVEPHRLGDSYMEQRNRIQLTEQHETIGGHIVLTSDEQKIDAILLQAKQREINQSLDNGMPFAVGNNFLLSRDQYEQSDVFKIIKKMPKGNVLH